MSLQVLLDLLEAGQASTSKATLLERHGPAVELLIGIGALVPGRNLSTVRCRACATGHGATVEYDAVTGRYCHFCPEAGLVEVADDDLLTYQSDIAWLLGQLEHEAPIAAIIRRELILDRAWYLGEAITGATQWSAVFARQCWTLARFGELGRRLRDLRFSEPVLVLTTADHTGLEVGLPPSTLLVDLATIARLQGGALFFDRDRLGRALQTAVQSRAGRKRGGGRPPTHGDWVQRTYARHKAQGRSYASKSEAARALADHWRQAFPDARPIGTSTIRTHLPDGDFE